MPDYKVICNHFGWNETSVLGLESKSRYHGYICLYILQYDWIDVCYVWWELKGNQGIMVTYVPISFRMIEMTW